MVAYSERDILRNKKFKYCRSFTKPKCNADLTSVGLPLHLGSSSIIQPSPSWKYTAIIRPADKKEDEKDKYSIEVREPTALPRWILPKQMQIWDDGHMIKSIPTDNKHGFIYSDSASRFFSSQLTLSWPRAPSIQLGLEVWFGLQMNNILHT